MPRRVATEAAAMWGSEWHKSDLRARKRWRSPGNQALLDAQLFIRFALINQDQHCSEDVSATPTSEIEEHGWLLCLSTMSWGSWTWRLSMKTRRQRWVAFESLLSEHEPARSFSVWVEAVCHFPIGRAAIRVLLPRQTPHSISLARPFFEDPGCRGEPIGWSREPASVRISAQLGVAH